MSDKHPGGRPTKYDPSMVDTVFKLSLLGSTDEEIADFLEIGTTTLYRWFNEHEEFREARKTGGRGADQEVARSLYNKAREGDTTAMIFWLKNRNPAAWRDRRQHEVSGPDGGPIQTEQLSNASEEDLKAQIQALNAALEGE